MSQLPSQSSSLFKFLRFIGFFLPGNFLKTWFYLNLVAKPRRFWRRCLHTFYRMDQIYAVLKEAKANYSGNFAILEFGTAAGYTLNKMLYATKYMKMADRVQVHAFDSFEGLPPAEGGVDDGLVRADWAEGQYRGSFEKIQAHCDKRYKNHRFHKGYFEDSMTPESLEVFKTHLPILVWVDCDLYSSTKTLFERLLPYIPNGCVVYFDDFEFNYGSRLTCEARFVYEFNRGDFGEDMELVLDRELSMDSQRIYRFVRSEPCIRYPSLEDVGAGGRNRGTARPMGNASPLP